MATVETVRHDKATLDTNCLFEQPWWLEAVAPGQWHAATVTRGGEVIARMAYVLRRRYGLTFLTQPPLTQTLGPWIRPAEGKYENRLSDQHERMTELIQQLPSCDLFSQTFSPTILNALPFHWNGYQTRILYTYRISDLSDLDLLWKECHEGCRRAIRKAEKQVVVREDLGIESFYEVIRKTYARQDMEPPYGIERLSPLIEACERHGAGRIFHAEDAQGRIHGVLFLVWDSRAAYYLIGGGDPDLRNSGAQSLLMWQAIKFASSRARVFDFEGSMHQPIERFFRSFGARQTPMLHVLKVGRRMAALTAAKDLLQACIGRSIKWFY
jgi:hypothetical protein